MDVIQPILVQEDMKKEFSIMNLGAFGSISDSFGCQEGGKESCLLLAYR